MFVIPEYIMKHPVCIQYIMERPVCKKQKLIFYLKLELTK
jgi:hypothetical protein